MTLGRYSLALATAMSLGASHLRAQQGPATPAESAWWHDITVIADDSMHGRRTGTADYVKAAHYVADQFASMGLQPGGTDGFFQTVHLAEARIVPEGSSIVLQSGTSADTLPLTVQLKPSTAAAADGPMVFVGYGLNLPGAHDDLAGVDLHGKVAVYLNRMPQGLGATMFAHGRASRWRELQ